VITLHGRTREQYYSGKADWDSIKRVKQSVSIPVIGNGDIQSPEDAKRMMEHTKCDGIMIGRAAQGNPWIFKRTVHYLETGQLLPMPSFEERKSVILKHVKMLVDFKGEYIGVREMRTHLASYIKGVHGATAFRKQFMKVETIKEIEDLLEQVFA
jgi:nifR3 family TIM-barrel protein